MNIEPHMHCMLNMRELSALASPILDFPTPMIERPDYVPTYIRCDYVHTVYVHMYVHIALEYYLTSDTTLCTVHCCGSWKRRLHDLQ